MAAERPHAIVLGAGIGGLCAAISLRQAGLEVDLYEQVGSLSEIGAGIQISPNSSRVLHHLGLERALDAIAVRPHALESRDWATGELLGSYAVNGEPLQYGSPHYLVYRPELLDALLGALPAERLHLQKRCVEIEQGSGHVTVGFADGSDATGDLAVGADGIHSTVRSALFGDDQPTFSGTVAYRGLVASDAVAHLEIPNTSTKWWGPMPEHHLVHYPIASGTLVNVVGVVPEEEWVSESWTAKGDPSSLVNHFSQFAAPVPELVEAVNEVYKFAIYDRPPLERWTVGRITLLGDASHPMVPFMAQGASMAIEDAAVLGRCLEGVMAADLSGPLERYDKIRRQRTDRMQIGSRVDTSATWNVRDWVYGYDPYAVPLRAER